MDAHEKKIMAILDARMKEAEGKMAEWVRFHRDREEHMVMNHGTGQTCSCPEWRE